MYKRSCGLRYAVCEALQSTPGIFAVFIIDRYHWLCCDIVAVKCLKSAEGSVRIWEDIRWRINAPATYRYGVAISYCSFLSVELAKKLECVDRSIQLHHLVMLNTYVWESAGYVSVYAA